MFGCVPDICAQYTHSPLITPTHTHTHFSKMFKCLETREKGVQGVVWHIEMAPETVLGPFGEVRVRELASCFDVFSLLTAG